MPKLTKELILSKCKVQNLDEVRNLNLWGSELDDISIIKELKNVEVVSLSVNKIKSLKYFSSCSKLTELYLRKNVIEDLDELYHLIECKLLRILWLGENPCCNNPNYRSMTIRILPQILKLDNIVIENEEREENNKAKIESSPEGKKKRIMSVISTKNEIDSYIKRDYSENKYKNVNSNGNKVFENDYMSKIQDLNQLQQIFSTQPQTDNNYNNYNAAKNNKGINQYIPDKKVQFKNKPVVISQNIHVIKAINNLMDGLSESQLLFLRRMIENKLNKNNYQLLNVNFV